MEKNDVGNTSQAPSMHPNQQPSDHGRSYRGPLRVGATVLALATAVGGVTYAANHHKGKTEIGIATDTLPSSSPTATIQSPPPSPEAALPSPDLSETVSLTVQNMAGTLIDLSNKLVSQPTYEKSDDGSTMTMAEIVDGSNSTLKTRTSYKYVVSGKPDASGVNIDPTMVNEIQLEADSGDTALFRESLSQNPETGDWAVSTYYVKGNSSVTFNYSTDPFAADAGKKVLDDSSLSNALASANEFINHIEGGLPVGQFDIPNITSEDVAPPASDPGLTA